MGLGAALACSISRRMKAKPGTAESVGMFERTDNMMCLCLGIFGARANDQYLPYIPTWEMEWRSLNPGTKALCSTQQRRCSPKKHDNVIVRSRVDE
jgi:hypothetical protein